MTGLIMWTVCDNPSDHPGKIVIRPHEITAKGPVALNVCWVYPDLETARAALMASGLTAYIPRSPADDPVIVETWL